MKKLLFLILSSSLLLTTSCTKDKDPIPDDSDLITYHMVLVEGGSFVMGCTSEQGEDCEQEETPYHIVELGDFYIGKYEVTQQLWKDIMGENPSHFQGCDQCPVEQVSWMDIQEFLAKLNEITGKGYRLPTEAEWEYAARGGNHSGYPKYSGSDEVDLVAWYQVNSENKTHPVGERKANELGLYDMSGNVWEWCQDWYGPYVATPQSNPTGPSEGTTRIVRGGGWMFPGWDCRVSCREWFSPESNFNFLGFRLVRD